MAISNEAKIKVTIDGKEAEISLAQLGASIQASMKKASDATDQVKTKFQKFASTMQTAFYTLQNLSFFGPQLKEMSALALKAQDVKKAFSEITPPDFLKTLRENVKGTVDDFTLMQGAVQAIDLGASTEQLKTFAEFARLEALRKGGDTATRFQEIISGVLRGSTELLDNFGINLTDLNRKIEELAGPGKKLSAVERRAISVNAAVALMTERMKKFGDQAVSDSERAKQFETNVANLKIQGGQLINTFLVPLQKLITPIVTLIGKLDQGTIAMIGTLGLAAATVFKVVIPALKAFGVASKSAMGWIGLIVAAIELLYMAWDTNFLGIRDAVDTVWRYLKGFWEYIKGWAKTIGNVMTALGKMIWGALSLDREKAQAGWKELQTALVTGWTDTMLKIAAATKKGTDPPAAVELKKNYQSAGLIAGTAFGEGMKQGQANAQLGSTGLTGGIRGIAGPGVISINEKETVQSMEIMFTAFDKFMLYLSDTRQRAAETFGLIQSSINTVSAAITNAFFGARVKLKDVWRGIAMDFTQFFIQEVLKQITKVLVVQMLKLLALFDKRENDLMAQRVGGDYARHFMTGMMKQMNAANPALAMAGAASGKVIINNNISGAGIYKTVANEKRIENVRRGKAINNDIF